eukprot:TRINITY_DN4132_c0_g1_i2.p1 TRINITY_DN4132_c0_g1~~TRINITY_DN4132_c0_g1_i2.p1  ORF type:complete len:284 (-),score=53.78 TRINITY_DN4132_c0_g1_i2:116-967(-)
MMRGAVARVARAPADVPLQLVEVPDFEDDDEDLVRSWFAEDGQASRTAENAATAHDGDIAMPVVGSQAWLENVVSRKPRPNNLGLGAPLPEQAGNAFVEGAPQLGKAARRIVGRAKRREREEQEEIQLARRKQRQRLSAQPREDSSVATSKRDACGAVESTAMAAGASNGASFRKTRASGTAMKFRGTATTPVANASSRSSSSEDELSRGCAARSRRNDQNAQCNAGGRGAGALAAMLEEAKASYAEDSAKAERRREKERRRRKRKSSAASVSLAAGTSSASV